VRPSGDLGEGRAAPDAGLVTVPGIAGGQRLADDAGAQQPDPHQRLLFCAAAIFSVRSPTMPSRCSRPATFGARPPTLAPSRSRTGATSTSPVLLCSARTVASATCCGLRVPNPG